MGKLIDSSLADLIQALAEPIAAAVLERLKPAIEAAGRASAPRQPVDRLLRVDEVLQRVGVSKSGWFAGVKSGRYPKPTKLGSASAWRESEIDAIVAKGADTK